MASSRYPAYRGRGRGDNDATKKKPSPYVVWGGIAAGVVLVGIVGYAIFGGRTPPGTTTDPEAKTRLERLFEAHKSYVQEKKKAPADEKTFKEFLQEMPEEQKKAMRLPNVDQLFISPNDNQPYVIRYGVRPNPGGATEAIMWEQTGQNGQRYVALNIGYVQRYSDQDFQELKKK